jgi:hypothetical protein
LEEDEEQQAAALRTLHLQGRDERREDHTIGDVQIDSGGVVKLELITERMKWITPKQRLLLGV